MNSLGIGLFVADESELNVKDDKKGFTSGVWGLAALIRSQIPLLIIHCEKDYVTLYSEVILAFECIISILIRFWPTAA